MKPKISILIPVYKAEKYIKQCLQTIWGLTNQNLEIIILHNASPYSSMAIAGKPIQQATNLFSLLATALFLFMDIQIGSGIVEQVIHSATALVFFIIFSFYSSLCIYQKYENVYNSD